MASAGDDGTRAATAVSEARRTSRKNGASLIRAESAACRATTPRGPCAASAPCTRPVASAVVSTPAVRSARAASTAASSTALKVVITGAEVRFCAAKRWAWAWVSPRACNAAVEVAGAGFASRDGVGAAGSNVDAPTAAGVGAAAFAVGARPVAVASRGVSTGLEGVKDVAWCPATLLFPMELMDKGSAHDGTLARRSKKLSHPGDGLAPQRDHHAEAET